jgi:hypothetical protein
LSEGHKKFRSSGVQEFRSSGVQEFRSSGVQEFRSSRVQEFRRKEVFLNSKGTELRSNITGEQGLESPSRATFCNS